jgi:hypothetical protein
MCAVLALAVGGCHSEPPVALHLGALGDPEPLKIGPAATDTFSGWLPDNVTLSPFDVSDPIVAQLDPLLLKAVQDAARSAEADGIKMRITSGWRTKGFQQRLFDMGVLQYGGVDAARRFVASPETSKHVVGEAGSRFGLCQIFANELWHFELAVDEQGRCPPLKPSAAG